MKKIKPKYMIATKAFHQLGNISSNIPDLCVVNGEDDENYYGFWVTGFGFYDVRFPKETTKNLTEEEVEKFDGRILSINETPIKRLKIKED